MGLVWVRARIVEGCDGICLSPPPGYSTQSSIITLHYALYYPIVVGKEGTEKLGREDLTKEHLAEWHVPSDWVQ